MDVANLSEVTPGAWLMIAIVGLLLSFAVTAVSYRVTEAFTVVEERLRARLRREATDHGEPSREQVEAPWRLPATAAALPRRGEIR